MSSWCNLCVLLSFLSVPACPQYHRALMNRGATDTTQENYLLLLVIPSKSDLKPHRFEGYDHLFSCWGSDTKGSHPMSLPHPVVSRAAAFVVASGMLSAEHLWTRNLVLY